MHLATKFVLRSPGWSSLSVPPTICFTCPLCKSMQGLNADLRRGSGIMVMVLFSVYRLSADVIRSCHDSNLLKSL